MTDIYRLADLNIEITSVFQRVHDLCKDYRFGGVECRPDITVCTDQTDIEFERKKTAKKSGAAGHDARYSDQYLEQLAVYRKISERLPEFDTFLFHASAVAVNGGCYVFTAKSGTGKSTHTRLWRELLGPAAVMINDDKPLIKVAETETLVYGTPWDGKHHLNTNTSVPLRAVCILKRGEKNSIYEISKEEAFPVLLQQAYRPADPVGTKKLIDLLGCMRTTYYLLQCNMDISAAELSYRTMSGKQLPVQP